MDRPNLILNARAPRVSSFRQTVRRLRLRGQAALLRRAYEYSFWRRYRGVETFELTVEGRTVVFSTRDERAKRFFFPRYAGGKLHEGTLTQALLGRLRGAGCFMDVGACVGYYSCLAAAFLPQGRVVAFEMDERNYAILRENLFRNGFDNVEAVHTAVSEGSGSVRYDPRTRFTDFAILPPGEPGNGTVGRSVRSISLDDYVKQTGQIPDVVKIDVEGAEQQVLRGMRWLIQEHAPLLFIEVHERKLRRLGASPQDVVSQLLGYGCRVWEVPEFKRSAEASFRLLSSPADIDPSRVSLLYVEPGVPAKRQGA